MLELYQDLKADVRHDRQYHVIKSLVQPNDPTVRDVARVLVGADCFIKASQEFVNSFTTYRREIGDFWATPAETMTPRCPVCTSSEDLVPLSLYENLQEVHKCTFCGWRGIPVRAGDCDDKAILLCSILRNYMPPEQVFCAIGLWTSGGEREGHMWVVTPGENGQDRIVEATASPSQPIRGKYTYQAIFNDRYALATSVGLKEFDLHPVEGFFAEALI